MGQRANIGCIAEVDQLLVNEGRIGCLAAIQGKGGSGVIVAQPILSVVCALLVEGKGNGLVRAWIPNVIYILIVLV